MSDWPENGQYAAAVLRAVADETAVSPADHRMRDAEWSVSLHIDTGEPLYDYACKRCGHTHRIKTLGDWPVSSSAHHLIATFLHHRCLQHAIKCTRCSTNMQLLMPHVIDEETAERQMVLWTEEFSAMCNGGKHAPPVFRGLARIDNKQAWVEINSEPTSGYWQIMAVMPSPALRDATKGVGLSFARIELEDAKRIRSSLDAWIYAREHIDTAPIVCRSCDGVGRYYAGDRYKNPCDQCRGVGRTQPDGSPLPKA